MSEIINDVNELDSDSENEDNEINGTNNVDEEAVLGNEDGGGDELLAMNSTMFTKTDYEIIEKDKSNVSLFMKLAELGANVDSAEYNPNKILTEDDYIYMRNLMFEKLGSWVTKYLSASIPIVEDTSKNKNNKKSTNKKGTTLSKADIIIKQNTQKLLNNDIESMKLMSDLSVAEVNKWHHHTSLLIYMLYWSLHVVHALKGKLKIDNKLISISPKIALDCYMSLYRSSKELREAVPSALLSDIEIMDSLLLKQLNSKISNDLLSLLVVEYPELISDTQFDLLKPKSIQLYEEQKKVLQIINDCLNKDKPLLLGYQVPPSGGKTILSVAIASLLSHKYRDKKLLYVCYNTLVRKAVANACVQGGIPLWIASTRKKDDGEVSAVRPSNSCLSMSRAAKRERYNAAKSSGISNKEGKMEDMLSKAASNTIHHCPIVIADLASAIKILKLYPEEYVAYIDEPTAGAERGIENNKITELVANICAILPKQSVLLSATLPDISTELPSLQQHFMKIYPNGIVETISSLRLPVGCDALDPTGKLVLPHQLANDFNEFKVTVSKMSHDALMQRFYTPAAVKQLALKISEKISLPEHLIFENVIPHIGAIRHAIIRTYAQHLLEYISSLDNPELFEYLKVIPVINNQSNIIPCTPNNLLVNYCTDGRALAVGKTRKVLTEENDGFETLDVIVKLALTPYESRIPKLKVYLTDYMKRLEIWKAEGQSLSNAKVSKRDKDAAMILQDQIISHDQNRPTFEWPVKIHGRGAILTIDEIEKMSDDITQLLLSGVGYYDPSSLSYDESTFVINEAVAGHLACLFASPFIVYGTNIDLSTVFIGSSYSNKATRNALYQLIGRAGRTGKSHRAKVLFQDFDALKRAMIPAKENIEANIIEHHLKAAIHRYNNPPPPLSKKNNQI